MYVLCHVCPCTCAHAHTCTHTHFTNGVMTPSQNVLGSPSHENNIKKKCSWQSSEVRGASHLWSQLLRRSVSHRNLEQRTAEDCRGLQRTRPSARPDNLLPVSPHAMRLHPACGPHADLVVGHCAVSLSCPLLLRPSFSKCQEAAVILS